MLLVFVILLLLVNWIGIFVMGRVSVLGSREGLLDQHCLLGLLGATGYTFAIAASTYVRVGELVCVKSLTMGIEHKQEVDVHDEADACPQKRRQTVEAAVEAGPPRLLLVALTMPDPRHRYLEQEYEDGAN